MRPSQFNRFITPTESVVQSQHSGNGRHPSLVGDIRYHRQVYSKYLANARDLIVYLPPCYSSERTRTYPVLYMHDGQNLMDSTTSFHYGMEWKVDDHAEALIRAGVIEPLIIVGIYNIGATRIDEYTPVPSRIRRLRTTAGGRADDYARFILNEVIPLIRSEYRVKAGPAHTGLAGSSLGGLVTLYFGMRYPEVFGKLGVLSPAAWWNNRWIIDQVRDLPTKLDLKIWLDMGRREGPTVLQDARKLSAAIIAKGWNLGDDLQYHEEPSGTHNEGAWANRFDQVLKFLFRTGR